MRAELIGAHRTVYRASNASAEVVVTLFWALTITALPVIFHLAGQWAGIAACVLLTLIVACFVPIALPGTLVFCWTFQSVVVSLVSPAIGEADLTTIRAYSFLTTAVAWVVVTLGYWTDRKRFSPEFRALMGATTISLIAIAIYTALGMATNPSSALIYLRSLATPFFLFQIFALVAYRQQLSLTPSLLVAGLAIVAYGYAELLMHETLFRLVNGDHFMSLRVRQDYESGAWLKELRESGRVMRSYLDTLQIDLFNTPLLADLKIQIYRLVGPNFHPISFAYALAFFSLIAISAGHRWFLLLSAPLLIVIGSKGAVILTLFVVLLLGLSRIARLSTVLVVALAGLVLYAVAGIVIGMKTQDYHVIGFIGGLNGFMKNPFGHGIGVGGNLSLNMVAAIDWNRSQTLGQTDVAVESAVGVLLYQMGLAAAFVFYALLTIASRLLKIAGNAAQGALMSALSILVLCVNGVFQEEALFAPLALALTLGFAGFVLGRTYREREELYARLRQPRRFAESDRG